MRIRKKKIIDPTDRDILRFMRNARREVTGHQIAKKVNISSPAIRPRLNSLRSMGIIKPTKQYGIRSFDRTFKNITKTIKAPSKILWGLDIRKKRKRR